MQTYYEKMFETPQRSVIGSNEQRPDTDTRKVVPKLTAGDIERKFASFTKLYHSDALSFQLAVPTVLQALHASLEESGGSYPLGGPNLSFFKMGSSYDGTTEGSAKLGLRIGEGGHLVTGPVEGNDIEMEALKIIESFIRKLYSILFVYHDEDASKSRAGTGGQTFERDTAGLEPIDNIKRHISARMVNRYIEILHVEKLARTVCPKKLVQHLNGIEKELRTLTTSPHFMTIDAALSNQLGGFRGWITACAAVDEPPRATPDTRSPTTLPKGGEDKETLSMLSQLVRELSKQVETGKRKRKAGTEKGEKKLFFQKKAGGNES
jgi:hypothetical protein